MSERVLVCGDRWWNDYYTILKRLDEINKDKGIDSVIEGEAEGADKMGAQAARQLGIVVFPFPANWKKYGNNAGPIRNLDMLAQGKPTLVLAFHNFIQNSKGTKHMVNAARMAGVPVEIISNKHKRAPEEIAQPIENLPQQKILRKIREAQERREWKRNRTTV